MKPQLFLSQKSKGLLLVGPPNVKFENGKFIAKTQAEVDLIKGSRRYRIGQIVAVEVQPTFTPEERAAMAMAKELKSRLRKDALRKRADLLCEELEVEAPAEDATVADLISFIVLHETGIDLDALKDR